MKYLNLIKSNHTNTQETAHVSAINTCYWQCRAFRKHNCKINHERRQAGKQARQHASIDRLEWARNQFENNEYIDKYLHGQIKYDAFN